MIQTPGASTQREITSRCESWYLFNEQDHTTELMEEKAGNLTDLQSREKKSEKPASLLRTEKAIYHQQHCTE